MAFSELNNDSPEAREKAKKLRKLTVIGLATCTLLLAGWDTYVAFNDVKDDTVSEVLRDVSHEFYSLPFILMVVMGHLFWNEPLEDRPSRDQRLKLFFTRVLPLGVLMLARDLVNWIHPLPSFSYANLVAAIAGFLVGAKWWPQAIPDSEGDQDGSVHPERDRAGGRGDP